MGQAIPRGGFKVVLLKIAMLVVPVALTLRTVEVPGTLEIPSQDPTPLGYTWSLLLFIVPLLTIAWWFLRHPSFQFQRKAYWTTVAILVPIGVLLDLLLGNTFFEFPNHGAVLGIEVPAVGGTVPVEELVFYLSGFMFILLFYIWNDEYWMAAYNAPDYAKEGREMDRIVKFHLGALLFGAILVAAALFYKMVLSGTSGFPGYFLFLVAVAIVPAVGFFRSARRFINWRAVGSTSLLVVLISLLWEATLALPYGWWGFREDWMLGLFIEAWSGLPIEEPILWLAVTFTTVIVYEVVKIWQASGRGLMDAMLGTPTPAPRR